jgi:uncharacterized membrane protein
MSANRTAAANIAQSLPVRQVPVTRIADWLVRGWQDIRRAPGLSLLHGLIVTFASIVIVQLTAFYWPILPGALSGFVLVGPVLATGLYAISRRLEDGERPRIRDIFCAWRCATGCLIRFNVLLVMVGTLWVLMSALLFNLFVAQEIDDPVDFLRYVLTQSEHLFLLWTLLGGLATALVFSITVISVPLLLDRDIDMITAMLTSIRVVGENPGAMTAWALVIMFATGLSFISLMLGFVVLYPLLGHASWHLYRDLVDPASLPAREVEGLSGN